MFRLNQPTFMKPFAFESCYGNFYERFGKADRKADIDPELKKGYISNKSGARQLTTVTDQT